MSKPLKNSRKLKKLPKFKSEQEERDFWLNHDSKDYIDWSKAEPIFFPNLKLSSSPVSIRFPNITIWRVKERANQIGMPYQSLIKLYVTKQLELDTMPSNSKTRSNKSRHSR